MCEHTLTHPQSTHARTRTHTHTHIGHTTQIKNLLFYKTVNKYKLDNNVRSLNFTVEGPG